MRWDIIIPIILIIPCLYVAGWAFVKMVEALDDAHDITKRKKK